MRFIFFGLLLALFLAPAAVLADTPRELRQEMNLDPCPLKEFLPDILCLQGGADGAADLITKLQPIAMDIFLGLLAFMFLVYAIILIVGSGDENSVTEARKAFMFAIIASFVVFFRENIASTVPIGEGGEQVVDLAALSDPFTNILTYIQIAAAAAAIGFVAVRGIQMISAGGDEGQASTQRKLLLNAFVGVGIIMLAGQIVKAAQPGGFGVLSQEVSGIAGYVMFIFGACLVFSVLVGAAMMILSYDESMQERGKKAVFASLIILAVLVCTKALIDIITI